MEKTKKVKWSISSIGPLAILNYCSAFPLFRKGNFVVTPSGEGINFYTDSTHSHSHARLHTYTPTKTRKKVNRIIDSVLTSIFRAAEYIGLRTETRIAAAGIGEKLKRPYRAHVGITITVGLAVLRRWKSRLDSAGYLCRGALNTAEAIRPHVSRMPGLFINSFSIRPFLRLARALLCRSSSSITFAATSTQPCVSPVHLHVKSCAPRRLAVKDL